MNTETLGYDALKRGHYQEAVNIFRKLIAQKKSIKDFLGLGKAYEGLGELWTARWAYNQALLRNPEYPEGKKAAADIEELIDRDKKEYPVRHKVNFRTLNDGVEKLENGRWVPFYIKGINLGLGLPGFFPGEYGIGKGTYRQWLKQMCVFGFNTIRIYTLHPTVFYEALYELNEEGHNLYLIQGVWAELPEDDDLDGKAYSEYTRRQVAEAVDVVYGATTLPERLGMPNGTYKCNVSQYTMGFLLTREWESCTARSYNSRHGGKVSDYDGAFLRLNNGTPFERWVGGVADSVAKYEYEKYGLTHPVSVVCWPTLDPLGHPSESTYGEGLEWQGQTISSEECNEDEDVVSLDLAKITVKQGNGFFASYHVYPYYPDFMNNDYIEEKDPYAAYLRLLKQHHGSQPVIIAEFGVPDSREISHWHFKGWHHGGHSDIRQGEIDAHLMRSIHKTGLAGGIVFSWFDEWFKRNWLFTKYELPAERKALWFNLQDAEECYGLIAAYPGYPDKLVTLTGSLNEWKGATVLAEQNAAGNASAGRGLRRLKAQQDEGFLYLLLETAAPVDFNETSYLIGLDTCDPDVGEFSLPYLSNTKSPVGLKFVVCIGGPGKSRILVCKAYDKYLNGNGSICPVKSSEGAWAIMQNRTNERRISKDRKHFFPARVSSMSNLQFGSLSSDRKDYNSLSDIHVQDNTIELRIPWGLINFTDPSSHIVLWKQGKQMTRQTDGVRVIAASCKTSNAGNVTVGDALPRSLSRKEVRTFSWPSWEAPTYHLKLKAGAAAYKRLLSELP